MIEEELSISDAELIARLQNSKGWPTLGNAAADRIEALVKELDELRASIFGSTEYTSDLRNGNFVEMAETLHAAQKGGLARAEAAEADYKRESDQHDATVQKLLVGSVALKDLIEHTHYCEKELTEKLHHVEFCGESYPLTTARAFLAKHQVSAEQNGSQK